MTSHTRVFCLIIDHKKRPLDECFGIKLSSEDLIDDLKEKAKENLPKTLGAFDITKLKVWRCPGLRNDETPAQTGDRIKAIDFSNEKQAERLRPSTEVMSLKLSKSDLLLVQIPGTSLFSFSSQLFLKYNILLPNSLKMTRLVAHMSFSAFVLASALISRQSTKPPNGMQTLILTSRQNELSIY
jgi:hypothetical protein